MSLLLSTGAFASSLSGAAPGMVLVSPTSITHSGTSATLGANGQVTFTAVTSLSLNGVFSADFDNYVVVTSGVGVGGTFTQEFRFRASGTDATGADYTQQRLRANGTSVSANRSTAQTEGRAGQMVNTSPNGNVLNIYGPFLSQPTATRSIHIDDFADAFLDDYACTHSLSTSYDGITFVSSSNSLTGKLAVYGVRS